MPKTEKPSTLSFVHSFRSDHSNAIKNNDKAIHSKKIGIVLSSLATESELIYPDSESHFSFGALITRLSAILIERIHVQIVLKDTSISQKNKI